MVSVEVLLTSTHERSLSLCTEYSIDDGKTFQRAPLAPGLETDFLPASPEGVLSIITLNLRIRGVGMFQPESVRLRLTPIADEPGSPVISDAFEVFNRNTKPSIILDDQRILHIDGGVFPLASCIDFGYWLLDGTEGNWCDLTEVSFSVDGKNFFPASLGPGGSGISNLRSGPEAIGFSGANYHRLVWDAYRDLSVLGLASVDNAMIRITASDGLPSDPAVITVGPVGTWGLKAGDALWRTFDGDTGFSFDLKVPHGMAVTRKSVFGVGESYHASKWAVSEGDLFDMRMDLLSEWDDFDAYVPSGDGGTALAVAVSTYKIFLLGLQWEMTGEAERTYWLRVEKRDIQTGLLERSVRIEPSLGVVNVSSPDSYTLAMNHAHIALRGRHLYLAVTERLSPSSDQFAPRLFKMNASDLSMVQSCGQNVMIRVTDDPSPQMHEVRAMIVDGTDWWIIGNEISGTGFRTRIEKRNSIDGGLNSTFGTGGILSPSESSASVGADVKDGDLYVFQLGQSGCQTQGLLEKRRATDGALIASKPLHFTSSNGHVRSQVLVDGNDLFLMSTSTDSVGIDRWRIEKRHLSLDPNLDFGTNGAIEIHPAEAGYSSRPAAMAMSERVLYVTGSNTRNGEGRGFVEAVLR